MILDDVRLGEPDRDGFCEIAAYKKDRLVDVVETMPLVPGTRIDYRTKTLRIPVNCRTLLPPAMEAAVAPTGRKLREYQALAVAEIERSSRGYMVCFDVGVGKELPVTTKVLTPTGWREIGAISIGDEVIGSTGRATTVVGVYPQGVKPVYRVTFSDGSNVEAGADHRWAFDYRVNGRRWSRAIITTDQLRSGKPLPGRSEVGGHLHLPLVKPVVFASSNNPPLPAYVMGQLLGNGCFVKTSVSLSTNIKHWPEVRARLEADGIVIGSTVFRNHACDATLLGVIDVIKKLGLCVGSPQKYVPPCYKQASIEDRVALLQGLLDSDGTIGKCNRIRYSTTSLQLATDVREVVESLGGTGTVYCYKSMREDWLTHYEVRVRLPVHIEPFSVKAKSSRYNPKRPPSRTVRSVEYTRDTATVCIAVAAEDGLYATEHCILTHNTDPVCYYLYKHKELRPFVIVAPLIASNSWRGPTSSGHHYGLRIEPLRTRTPDEDKLPKDVDGYFVNFEILKEWGPWLHMRLDPKAVIVDEGHEMRNPRTDEAKAVRKLCRLRSVEKRIWLTATPVVNGVIDLYNQLDTVQPGMWGTMVPFSEKMVTSFGTRYCQAAYNGYGWSFGTESNVDELKHRLSTVLLRRTRAEVRSELPALQRERVLVDPAQLDAAAWSRYRDAAATAISGGSGDTIGRLSRMANELSWAKRKIAVDQAERLARGVEGNKIVVFAWYQRTTEYITKNLASRGFSVFGPITGKMAGAKRLEEAERFKDLPLPSGGAAAYVATLAAAGMSLNPLSAAAAALFTDLYWVPTQLIQAEGRVHREGQKANQVLIQYLIVDPSMDTRMWEALQHKAEIIAKATGDKTALSLCESLGGRSEEESMAAFLHDLEALSPESLGLK